MVRGHFVATLLFVTLVQSDTPQRNGVTPCPIPKLKVESYRPELRVQVQKAYQALQTNPADPNANGNLGMLLRLRLRGDGSDAAPLRSNFLRRR
jgi:hypothetical protein